MTVSADQLRQRFAEMELRRRYYEQKSGMPGALRRHEMWRHTYLARPYMVGAPDQRVAERFKNVFLNVNEIGSKGLLQPVPMKETDEYMQVFTHLLEEYGSRSGGPPDALISAARAPLMKYFENGKPTGYRMFEGYTQPSSRVLVKYGRREFLEQMFTHGKLRLSNAKFYNDEGFLDAVRDDETSRTFFIPTYKERLKGRSSITIRGNVVEFGDDDIVIPLVFDDYYLFSLCEKIHYRMPDDFNADSAIVIREPERFKQCLIKAFAAKFPNWEAIHGKVTYYDPYRDYSKFSVPEMAKHFGYAYQKEFRIVFRPKQRVMTKLEPLQLSVGPMTDYADFVTL